MTVQTTYTVDHVRALAGEFVDSQRDSMKISKVALAAIDFGLFVAKRAADAAETCRAPGATGDVTTSGLLLGVAMKDQTRRTATGGASTSGYAIDDLVTIARKGVIWVTCEEAMAIGDSVFVRFAAGAGGTVLGAVRNDADTATCVAVPNGSCSVAVPSSAAGIVGLNVNLP